MPKRAWCLDPFLEWRTCGGLTLENTRTKKWSESSTSSGRDGVEGLPRHAILLRPLFQRASSLDEEGCGGEPLRSLSSSLVNHNRDRTCLIHDSRCGPRRCSTTS